MPVTPNGVAATLERKGMLLYYLVTVDCGWPDGSRKFELHVTHRDNRSLTQAIREGVHGRAINGKWREIEKE